MLLHPTSSPPTSPDDEAHPAPLRVDISCPDAATLVLTPVGEVDCCTVAHVRRALAEAADAGRPRVIVNLDQVTFMDTSTLHALADARLRISDAGATIQVRCHDALRRRLFALSGLENLLDNSE